MTIAEQKPQVEAMPTQEMARIEVLHELLGMDYDFAEEQGLIDMFYYDPDTQQDGLLHTLSGVFRMGQGGERIPEGFHHEPSAIDDGTSVDRTHLEGARAKTRYKYAENAFEPYKARVKIGGFSKLGIGKNGRTGEEEVAETANGMYPKEYDALAVMQTIKKAHDSRDKSKDELKKDADGMEVMVNESSATLLDGNSMFTIRLVMEPSTEKILTAVPKPKTGIMKLSREAIRGHLLDDVSIREQQRVAK